MGRTTAQDKENIRAAVLAYIQTDPHTHRATVVLSQDGTSLLATSRVYPSPEAARRSLRRLNPRLAIRRASQV